MERPDVGDKDQLADRLLELVIRPLFAIGLQLQAITGLTQDAEVSRGLEAAIVDVDDLIKDVRAGVFDRDRRQAPEQPTHRRVRAGLGSDEPGEDPAASCGLGQPIPIATAIGGTFPSRFGLGMPAVAKADPQPVGRG